MSLFLGMGRLATPTLLPRRLMVVIARLISENGLDPAVIVLSHAIEILAELAFDAIPLFVD